ncbi:MAG: amidophosphoribosyltransferase [Acidobacteriota bacterium]|nr:MAG: amidophosphoribosyltransferase [Acidobacteriota bacterium]
MCGFIGLIGTDAPVREVHDGLLAIQHRGQDAAGIVAYDGRFHLHKGEGLVRDVFDPAAMAKVRGELALGHVRYPTVGSGGAEDAQPFVLTHPFGIAMAHNGNVVNYRPLVERLQRRGRRHLLSRCDVEVILNVFADSLARHAAGGPFSHEVYRAAVSDVFRDVHGAYSVVGFVAGEGLFAFRDPHGIKPICIGRRVRRDGRVVHAVASESVVLEALGYEIEHRPGPGEAVFIGHDGEVRIDTLAEPRFRPCVFEFVYFARPDSALDGTSVYRVRERMGRALADAVRRRGIEADVVVPVPESSRPAALEMARELGWPFREALVKNRYVGRTFIMPGDGARRRSVRHKLNVIASEVRGRRVLLVDDSIVRGTTSRQIVAMLREAGATEVVLCSTAPPLRHPCVYGIDMSTRRELIARDRDEAQIAELLGADRVVYQDLDDLVAAVRAESPADLEDTCHACFSGHYPTGGVDEQALADVELERLEAERERG